MKSRVGEEGDRKPDKETVCEFFFFSTVKSKQLRKILDLLENRFSVLLLDRLMNT